MWDGGRFVVGDVLVCRLGELYRFVCHDIPRRRRTHRNPFGREKRRRDGIFGAFHRVTHGCGCFLCLVVVVVVVVVRRRTYVVPRGWRVLLPFEVLLFPCPLPLRT